MNVKSKSRVISATFVLFFLFFQLWSDNEKRNESCDPPKTFPVEQLRADFAVFRQALQEGHGGLYRYTAKEELDRNFDKVYKMLTKPMTEMEFFKLLLPIIAQINDGHSGVNLSPDYNKSLKDKPLLFPFDLRFIKRKAYLFRNYSENQDVDMGGELIAINGTPVSKILETMLPLIPSDAHIQKSKFRKLESTHGFGQFFIYCFGEVTSYSVTYRPAGKEKIETIKVEGIKYEDVNGIFKKRYPEDAKEKPPISLHYRDGIPILKIRTFVDYAYQKAKINYPEFLETAFKEFAEKKIKHLIIDLQNNGGGSDTFGKMLAAYFLDKPFLYYKALEIKNNEFPFFKYTKIPPEQRKFPEERAKKNRRGWYDVLGHPNLGEQKPLQPTFTGKVYILINGGSFSASGECTSVIHFHKKALFAGEECGAGYYGNTSGFMPTVTLPNTNLQVCVPMVRYTMAVSGYAPDRGIIPDYPVSPTIEDLIQRRDTVLEYVLNLVKKTELQD